jgi:WD40 repeat protein
VEETGETEFQLWELSVSGARNIGGVTVTPGGGLTAIGFWPNLSRFVTVEENLSLKLWDATSGQLLTSISMAEEASSIGHSDIAFGLAVSPDGALIATGAMDGKVVLWDAGSGSPHLGLVGNGAPVMGVAFSGDGDLIAGAGFDGSGFIWDVETGELRQTIAGHGRWVGNVKFGPDGRRLLTGSGDTIAKLWDVETGAELLALEGHTGAIFGLGYSSDGTRLATGSADGSAILWDASSGEALLDFPGLWLEFTPDGRGLMTISVTELVARGFYLDTELLIEHARSRLTRPLTPQECRQYLHTAECPGS